MGVNVDGPDAAIANDNLPASQRLRRLPVAGLSPSGGTTREQQFSRCGQRGADKFSAVDHVSETVSGSPYAR